MSRGYPSMTALLGLLAIAGYQNRDKLAELLRGSQSNPGAPQPGGAGGATTGNLGGLLGGTSLGDLLSGGLRDLVDRFSQKGQGEVADSWVNRGPNKQIAPSQLEQAIGPDVLETLTQHTGLSREELLARLSRESARGCRQVYARRPDSRPCGVFASLGRAGVARDILNRDAARGPLRSSRLSALRSFGGSRSRSASRMCRFGMPAFFNYPSDIRWDSIAAFLRLGTGAKILGVTIFPFAPKKFTCFLYPLSG